MNPFLSWLLIGAVVLVLMFVALFFVACFSLAGAQADAISAERFPAPAPVRGETKAIPLTSPVRKDHEPWRGENHGIHSFNRPAAKGFDARRHA